MIRGAYAANVTPFRQDSELTIDKEAYLSHVNWLKESGLHGIVPFGTNGEGPLVSLAEKLHVLESVCARYPDFSTIPAVTEGILPEVRRAVRELNELPVEAILVLPPHYFKPADANGLYRFFEGVLEVSRKPVIVYHIPKYAVPVPSEVVEELPIWGVKDSSEDARYSSRLLETGKGVLSGTEQNLWASLYAGVDGSISALANFVPELLAELFKSFERGDEEFGRSLSSQLQEIRVATKRYPTPAILKSLAAQRHGTDMGTVRPPLNCVPEDADSSEILKYAQSVRNRG